MKEGGEKKKGILCPVWRGGDVGYDRREHQRKKKKGKKRSTALAVGQPRRKGEKTKSHVWPGKGKKRKGAARLNERKDKKKDKRGFVHRKGKKKGKKKGPLGFRG